MATELDLPQQDVTLTLSPNPPDTPTGLMWNEAQRRRRMLEGLWKEDLEEILDLHMARTRQRRQGPPDLTKNVFRSIILQLAVLYDRPPLVQNEDADAVAFMTTKLDSAGTWPLSMRLQQLVMGQREAARAMHVLPDGTMQIENVPRDLLHALATPDTPDEPHTFYRYRIRELEREGRTVKLWTRDCWSIAELDNPVFRIEDEDGKKDLTADFDMAPMSGANYPWRKTQGTESGMPVLPMVLYHAQRTGRLWDGWTGIEVVEGALRIAMYWTMWGHIVKDASWPQRYMVNLTPLVGREADSEAGEMVVDADPAAVLSLVRARAGMGTSIGQWGPGGDPEAIGKAIRDYASDLAADFDLSPGDIQRVHGDARSGYAIEITREGQRNAQRRAEPQFRRGDIQMFERLAAMCNSVAGTSLPEKGWDAEYAGVPLSMEERRVIVEEFRAHRDLGITSPVELRAKLRGIPWDQAEEELRQLRAHNAEFGGGL